MSFNRLLAEADPTKAAQAALVMAKATVHEPGVSQGTRDIAQQLIELGVDELTDLIRARRVEAVTSALRHTDEAIEKEDESEEIGAIEFEDGDTFGVVRGAPPRPVRVEMGPAGRRRRAGMGPAADIDREQAEAIRAWARRQGRRVKDGGGIPVDIVDAYIRAGGRD